MIKLNRTSIVKIAIGNEIYVYFNGELIFKRWINHGYSKVFHEREGLSIKAK